MRHFSDQPRGAKIYELHILAQGAGRLGVSTLNARLNIKLGQPLPTQPVSVAIQPQDWRDDQQRFAVAEKVGKAFNGSYPQTTIQFLEPINRNQESTW